MTINRFGGDPQQFKDVMPADVNLLHQKSDVDSGDLAQHHTLGTTGFQAAAGNHTHFTLGTSITDATPDVSPLPNDGIEYEVFTFPVINIPKVGKRNATTARIFAFFSARAVGNSASYWRLKVNGIEIDYHLGHNYTDQYLNVGASLSGSFDTREVGDTITITITGSADAAGFSVDNIGPAHINVSFD